MLEMSSADCAGFVSVTFWLLVASRTTCPKSRLEAERLTAPLVPKPLRLTVCGLPAALSEITRVPFWAPIVVGVKTTLNVHCVPGETVEPH